MLSAVDLKVTIIYMHASRYGVVVVEAIAVVVVVVVVVVA
jgi:hypothetical protein